MPLSHYIFMALQYVWNYFRHFLFAEICGFANAVNFIVCSFFCQKVEKIFFDKKVDQGVFFSKNIIKLTPLKIEFQMGFVFYTFSFKPTVVLVLKTPP